MAFAKAIARPSYHIGTTSYFCRVVIGTIGKVLLHEGITRDTRCCPIVLGRQHDIVWPSQRYRISIVFKKIYLNTMASGWKHDINQKCSNISRGNMDIRKQTKNQHQHNIFLRNLKWKTVKSWRISKKKTGSHTEYSTASIHAAGA